MSGLTHVARNDFAASNTRANISNAEISDLLYRLQLERIIERVGLSSSQVHFADMEPRWCLRVVGSFFKMVGNRTV